MVFFIDKCAALNVDQLNVQIVGQHKKGFSVGKAATGVVLTGGIGSLAGFAGKKTKKVDMICMNCGKQFKYKK